MTARLLVLWFGWLLLLAACKSREDPGARGTKVTAESSYDATETIDDEHYRFRLALPGPGWKLMREPDMRRIQPDARAGAFSTAGHFGSVIVERLPGATLEQAATLLEQAEPGAIVESQEVLEFQGLPAQRSVFVFDIETTRFRYVRVIFMRGEFLYQLLGWGQVDRTAPDDFTPFFAAFTLTEGEVRVPEVREQVLEQAEGITWEIRAGEYRSVMTELVLRPSAGWRYVMGKDLAVLNAEAELGLAHAGSTATLMLLPKRTRRSVGDATAAARHDYETTMGSWTLEQTREISGHAVEFVRFADDPSLEYLLGVLPRERSVVEVWLWYPKSTRDEALVAFEAALRGVGALPLADVEALTQRLLARDGPRKLATNSAFDGRVFRDFAHALTWTPPPGLFRVRIGDELIDRPDVALFAEEQLEGLALELHVHAGASASVADLHEGWASVLEERRDDVVELGLVSGSTSIGVIRGEGPDTVQGVVSLAHRGDAITLVAWGESVTVSHDELERALVGLRLHAELPEVEHVEGRCIDHRYGFSVVPPRGWASKSPVATKTAQMRSLVWGHGRSEVLVMAFVSAFMPDEAWMQSFMEQTLRDAVAAEHPKGEPERLEGTLDGRRSRRLVYPDQQIEIVSDGTLMIMLLGVRADDEMERFRASLRLRSE